MTRKHFNAIAAALAAARPPVDYYTRLENEQWRADCDAIADVCQGFNRAFNRDTFMEACYA